ncbi:uncharacterized protein LOC128249871 [Octopus bimaculoides]|uniref:uncharacterized protein LOC128249871 n=1 Tax=Octopus bimaculoides TaxID=37653 RepID=UPI0022E64CF6|nr:uncharacterized protein LOC128249871 [Octopus bimaculoides]
MNFFLHICLVIVVVGLQTLWGVNSKKLTGMKYCLSEEYCPEAWIKYPRLKFDNDNQRFCRRLRMYKECARRKGPQWCYKGLVYEYLAFDICTNEDRQRHRG